MGNRANERPVAIIVETKKESLSRRKTLSSVAGEKPEATVVILLERV